MVTKIRKKEQKMNNLWTVIKFELIRTFKKPSFWIGVLLLPAIWLVMGGIIYFTGQQTTAQMEELAKETFSFEITDESQIVSPKAIEDLGGRTSTNKQASIEKVKSAELDAYYFVPKDLSSEKVEVYGLNQESGKNDRYQTFISNLLKNSSIETVDQNKIIAINSSLLVDQKIYKDGQEYNQIYEMIAPGIFLVIFYLVIVLLSNQMLTSTTEEKENRVTEMILTSITSKTLIVGKIISLIILGLVQIAVLFLPVIIGYFVVSTQMNLPDITPLLANIKWEFWPIMTGITVLLAGFMMFTGLLVGIGAAMPTAKDANNYFGAIIMLLMVPFFLLSLFTTPEPSPIVQFFTLFPLTSPISLMLRNMLGTLTVFDGVAGVVILVISSAITIAAAIRIFRYGTISYGARVNLKQIFARK